MTTELDAIMVMATDWGIVSSPVPGGGNTLSDNTKQWIADVHKYRLLRIIPTPGSGVPQQAWIDGNVIDTIRIQGNWRSAVVPGSAYVILDMGRPCTHRSCYIQCLGSIRITGPRKNFSR